MSNKTHILTFFALLWSVFGLAVNTTSLDNLSIYNAAEIDVLNTSLKKDLDLYASANLSHNASEITQAINKLESVVNGKKALLQTKLAQYPHVSQWLDDITDANLINRLDELADNTILITKLNIDLGSSNASALKTFFEGNPGGVKAWEIVKHLDEGVRLNVSALGKLDNLLTSGKIPKPKLESALNGHLDDILNAADEVNLGKILDRLNLQHLDEAHFDAILQRLNTYPTLKQDLISNAHWFETFDDILKEPGKYWDILNEGNFPSGSALSQWGQGFWWKNLRELADQFEDFATAEFRTLNNIAFDKVVTQVTLEVNGIRIRIDYLGVDDAGKFHLGDAKFSTKNKNWDAEWLDAATDNQKIVFPLFQNGTVNSIVVKATDTQKIQQLEGIGLFKNANGEYPPIAFNNTTLKIFGSAANQQSVQSVVILK